MNLNNFHSGFVGVIGKPNVGKSTLLNTILNQKISIVSPKPQTTRTQIKGIYTDKDAQIVFIDTPGITQSKDKFEKLITKAAFSTLLDTDVILFLIEGSKPLSKTDITIAEKIGSLKNKNIIVGFTKVDLLKKREELLPIIKTISKYITAKTYLPISSLEKIGLNELIQTIKSILPPSPPLYPEDKVTDVWEKIIAAEIIREKIFLFTHQEIPYSTAVEIEEYKEKKRHLIYAKSIIYVERKSQKGILIGKNGEMLKKIGIASRKEIEELSGKKIYLELWVKVEKNWKEKKELLKRMGYIP